MKKLGTILIVTLTTILSSAIGFLLFIHFSNYKLIKDKNNKISLKYLDLDKYVNDQLKNNEIVIKADGQKYYYTYDILGIGGMVVNGNSSKDIIELDKLKVAYRCTDDTLKNTIDKINDNRVETIYPYMIKGKTSFEVVDGQEGNKIDTEKLYKFIVDNLQRNNIEVNADDFVIEKDKSKPTVENLYGLADKYNDCKVNYTNGFSIGLDDIMEFVDFNDRDYTINIREIANTSLKDEEKHEVNILNYLDKKIEAGLLDYDTVGKTRKFTTINGDTINISGGTYGNFFDSDKEAEYVLDKIKNLQSENMRKPIFSQEMADEIIDNYIEVDKEKQHLWYFRDGKVIMDTDVVTGKPSRKNGGTPSGTFFISERATEKTLRGEGYATLVHRWMRITGQGVGLHDAGWRSNFGGNIYISNGSHGCINLPASFAYELYDNTYRGLPVVIY